jgi:hypothetical protein
VAGALEHLLRNSARRLVSGLDAAPVATIAYANSCRGRRNPRNRVRAIPRIERMGLVRGATVDTSAHAVVVLRRISVTTDDSVSNEQVRCSLHVEMNRDEESCR